MDQRYAVRRFRPADLDRIVEIERASFGRFSYDRKLFAEFGRKCRGLFIVIEGRCPAQLGDAGGQSRDPHGQPIDRRGQRGARSQPRDPRRQPGARIDGRRQRTALGYAITCVRGERANLISIAVDPKARGKGVASSLLESTLRRLRLRGIERFTLMVRVSNRAARRFYERRGFVRVRRVTEYYEDGEDGILMARDCRNRPGAS